MLIRRQRVNRAGERWLEVTHAHNDRTQSTAPRITHAMRVKRRKAAAASRRRNRA